MFQGIARIRKFEDKEVVAGFSNHLRDRTLQITLRSHIKVAERLPVYVCFNGKFIVSESNLFV